MDKLIEVYGKALKAIAVMAIIIGIVIAVLSSDVVKSELSNLVTDGFGEVRQEAGLDEGE